MLRPRAALAAPAPAVLAVACVGGAVAVGPALRAQARQARCGYRGERNMSPFGCGVLRLIRR